ncbi:hypothetical protein QUF58_07975 [Anaerolineales bacterium HSG24]|nr:hypothetical protein [Anaerolineales bacterium HSG24]
MKIENRYYLYFYLAKSVNQAHQFWPEIIPILDTVSQQETDLHAERKSALFSAHLYGAVEFARSDDSASTQKYWQHALQNRQPHADELPQLAFAIAETTTRPWHRAFQQHPTASETLQRFVDSLGRSSLEDQLAAHLQPYQTILDNPRAIKNLQHIAVGGSIMRFYLYNLIGNRATLGLRSLKNRWVIKS